MELLSKRDTFTVTGMQRTLVGKDLVRTTYNVEMQPLVKTLQPTLTRSLEGLRTYKQRMTGAKHAVRLPRILKDHVGMNWLPVGWYCYKFPEQNRWLLCVPAPRRTTRSKSWEQHTLLPSGLILLKASWYCHCKDHGISPLDAPVNGIFAPRTGNIQVDEQKEHSIVICA